jgi:transcriptional regulator with XRE-family HTH domain
MATTCGNVLNDFGRRLRWLRKSRELTADRLSELSGVSRSYILLIESGKRREISSKVTAKLAKSLRVKPSYLTSESGLLTGECLPSLPSDVSQFILDADSLPYLRLAEKARKNELSPTTLDKLISFLIENEEELAAIWYRH